MNTTLETIFGLLGGLALFIFGMNMMSECLQKAAGEKMKSILAILTKNPVLGVIAGALTTAVLQSSSATTVMAIGFVSAGLMSLPQAISIIFGANIGTTITAQIIAFKISDYIYVFIFAGFIISFILKSAKWKNMGQTIFAFGVLFLGIETMGDVMKPLASSAFFVSLIEKVADIPILGVFVGMLMTLVVQSSSATIAVLQNFASQAGPDGVTSIIGLAGAIPVLLGDNIGTTITAILASIGQSRNAKRTALAHCIFNISGCLLFIWFVKPYAALIQAVSPSGVEVEVISRQIANAHTGFNLIMTAIWTPLIGLMVKIVMKLIPDGESRYQLKPDEPVYLDEKLIGQAVPSLHLLSKEVQRLGEMTAEMIDKMQDMGSAREKTALEEIQVEKSIIESVNARVNEYLSRMFSDGVFNEDQVSAATSIQYVLSDIVRTSGLCADISENVVKGNGKKGYSKEALKDLRSSFSLVGEMYGESLAVAFTGKEPDEDTLKNNKDILLMQNEKLRKNHVERVKKGKCDASLTESYTSILHSIDRMGNACINLSETKKIFKTSLSDSQMLLSPEKMVYTDNALSEGDI